MSYEDGRYNARLSLGLVTPIVKQAAMSPTTREALGAARTLGSLGALGGLEASDPDDPEWHPSEMVTGAVAGPAIGIGTGLGIRHLSAMAGNAAQGMQPGKLKTLAGIFGKAPDLAGGIGLLGGTLAGGYAGAKGQQALRNYLREE